MRDVIQKLLGAEEEAKRLVTAARTQAGQIALRARKRAEELAVLAKQEDRLETERLIHAATEQAQLEKQSRLARAAAEAEAEIKLGAAIRQAIVASILRVVCGVPRQIEP